MALSQFYLFLLVLGISQNVIDSFDCHKTEDRSRCQKWNKFDLTYSLSYDLPIDVQHRREEILRELQRAFDAWSKVSQFTFSEITDTNNADIKIKFSDASHDDCGELNIQQGRIRHGQLCTWDFNYDDGKTLAHSFPPEHIAHSQVSKLRGELHFNTKEQWKPVSGCVDENSQCSKWKEEPWFNTWCDNGKSHKYFGDMSLSSACPNCCNGWSFFPIALHEIGHLLGLDHSESYNSVMYATADNRRIILQEDDVRGITCLYGDQICEEFQFARNPAFNIEGLVPIVIAVTLCIIFLVSVKFYLVYKKHHKMEKRVRKESQSENKLHSTNLIAHDVPE